jgi:hypothetical protein
MVSMPMEASTSVEAGESLVSRSGIRNRRVCPPSSRSEAKGAVH